MSTDVNSLLCFCEGSHDVSFVSSVLERLMDFKIKEKIKFSEMPAPFNNLFKTRVTNYASQDIAIDFAYRFFIPSAVLYKKGIYIYIFDCGGNNQYKKVSSFLIDHISIFDEASVFPQGANEITKNCKYLFLYDADNRGVDLISDQIKEKLGKIGDKDFMNGTWDGSESKFGKVMQDKAVFVLSKTPQEGTLEDILESLFDFTHKDIMSKTKTAIWRYT